MHLCNDVACDRTVTHVDGRVCTLTHATYALDFRASAASANASSDASYRRATNVTARPGKRKRRSDTLAVRHTQPQQSSSASAAAADFVYTADVELARLNETSDIERVVRRIAPDLETHELTSVVAHVREVWYRARQVHATPPYATLEAHTLAVCENMALGGLRHADNTFVRSDPAMRAKMPAIARQPPNIVATALKRAFVAANASLYEVMVKWVRAHGVTMRLEAAPPSGQCLMLR